MRAEPEFAGGRDLNGLLLVVPPPSSVGEASCFAEEGHPRGSLDEPRAALRRFDVSATDAQATVAENCS